MQTWKEDTLNFSVSAKNDVLVLTALAPWLALIAIKVATVALAAAGPLASAFGFAFAGAASWENGQLAPRLHVLFG